MMNAYNNIFSIFEFLSPKKDSIGLQIASGKMSEDIASAVLDRGPLDMQYEVSIHKHDFFCYLYIIYYHICL